MRPVTACESEDVEVRTSEDTDDLIRAYFGDVRKYALLNHAEERKLWAQIADAQKRERRALSMAPTALSVLERVLPQELGGVMCELQDIAMRLENIEKILQK